MSDPVVRFAKLQGAGNDFVVVDGRPGRGAADLDWPAVARRVCDRHYGVGADGLLVAAAPQAAGVRFRMRMFNPDGSEAEMCGNGLRCFGRWLLDRGELPGGTAPDDAPVAVETAAGAAVETAAGVLAIRIADGGWFTIDMGRPRLAPVEIPLAPEAARGQPPDGPVLHLPLRVRPAGGAEETFDATCVSMGNPHAVVFVPEVDAVPLESIGPLLERHAAFPARANVEVCQVVNRERLRVRVWERGAGITLACGTGACAALVAARLHGHVEPAARLEVPGGELGVTWRGGSGGADGAPVYLSGPAEHVFDGTIGREASW